MNSTSILTYSEHQLLLNNGYKLIKQLGEGSYAKVCLSILSSPNHEDQPFACKIINTKKAPKDFVIKFLPRELDILSKIVHPHIIHAFCIYQKNFKYLTFMSYAERGDMLDYILSNGEIPEQLTRLWFHQIAVAVEYIHTINIAHRDIKCENILITKNFNVKLADFGFARFVVDFTGKQVTSATYCGSLAYASPEILRGKPYHPKCSDIWSLGVVLFIMLNKSLPFNDINMKWLYKQQMLKNYKFQSKIISSLSEEVKSLIAKLLEPDYIKRLTITGVNHDKWFLTGKSIMELSESERKALEKGQALKGIIHPKEKLKRKKSTHNALILLWSEGEPFDSEDSKQFPDPSGTGKDESEQEEPLLHILDDQLLRGQSQLCLNNADNHTLSEVKTENQLDLPPEEISEPQQG